MSSDSTSREPPTGSPSGRADKSAGIPANLQGPPPDGCPNGATNESVEEAAKAPTPPSVQPLNDTADEPASKPVKKARAKHQPRAPHVNHEGGLNYLRMLPKTDEKLSTASPSSAPTHSRVQDMDLSGDTGPHQSIDMPPMYDELVMYGPSPSQPPAQQIIQGGQPNMYPPTGPYQFSAPQSMPCPVPALQPAAPAYTYGHGGSQTIVPGMRTSMPPPGPVVSQTHAWHYSENHEYGKMHELFTPGTRFGDILQRVTVNYPPAQQDRWSARSEPGFSNGQVYNQIYNQLSTQAPAVGHTDQIRAPQPQRWTTAPAFHNHPQLRLQQEQQSLADRIETIATQGSAVAADAANVVGGEKKRKTRGKGRKGMSKPRTEEEEEEEAGSRSRKQACTRRRRDDRDDDEQSPSQGHKQASDQDDGEECAGEQNGDNNAPDEEDEDAPCSSDEDARAQFFRRKRDDKDEEGPDQDQGHSQGHTQAPDQDHGNGDCAGEQNEDGNPPADHQEPSSGQNNQQAPGDNEVLQQDSPPQVSSDSSSLPSPSSPEQSPPFPSHSPFPPTQSALRSTLFQPPPCTLPTLKESTTEPAHTIPFIPYEPFVLQPLPPY